MIQYRLAISTKSLSKKILFQAIALKQLKPRTFYQNKYTNRSTSKSRMCASVLNKPGATISATKIVLTSFNKFFLNGFAQRLFTMISEEKVNKHDYSIRGL